MTNRGSAKLLDGSLSDTQTYAEVKPDYSTYAMWLKHSNTATSRLSEGDAIESNSMGSPCLPRNYKLLHHRDASLMQSPRLNRSNSIRYDDRFVFILLHSLKCICKTNKMLLTKKNKCSLNTLLLRGCPLNDVTFIEI